MFSKPTPEQSPNPTNGSLFGNFDYVDCGACQQCQYRKWRWPSPIPQQLEQWVKVETEQVHTQCFVDLLIHPDWRGNLLPSLLLLPLYFQSAPLILYQLHNLIISSLVAGRLLEPQYIQYTVNMLRMLCLSVVEMLTIAPVLNVDPGYLVRSYIRRFFL